MAFSIGSSQEERGSSLFELPKVFIKVAEAPGLSKALCCCCRKYLTQEPPHVVVAHHRVINRVVRRSLSCFSHAECLSQHLKTHPYCPGCRMEVIVKDEGLLDTKEGGMIGTICRVCGLVLAVLAAWWIKWNSDPMAASTELRPT